MNKEEIAKELALEIKKSEMKTLGPKQLELVILKKLTEILNTDKGKLHKGTLR